MTRLHLTPTVERITDPSAPESDRKLLTISIGESSSSTRRIYLAEPTDRQDAYGLKERRFVFWFGVHCPTYVAVRARSYDTAFEVAAEYALDRWPGLGCTESVREEYTRLVADGKTQEQAWEESECDTISVNSGCDYLNSDECGDLVGDRDIDRTDLELLCYPNGADRYTDKARERWPMYQPTRAQYVAPVVPSHASLWSDVVSATLAAGRSERGTLAILDAIGDM